MVNEYQREIYESLMNICRNDECFFYADQILFSKTCRIFNYRLASYTQWLQPHALECRGITYHIDDKGEPVELLSWPFQKFFNYGECPFTIDIDLSKVSEIQDKMDGSLISTMWINNTLWLKSKGSLFSEQAQAANRLINSSEFSELKSFCVDLTSHLNYTVIMEYTSPVHRIVLDYPFDNLTVLAVRNNETGKFVKLEHFNNILPEKYVVPSRSVKDVNSFIGSIDAMKGIEGFVLVFPSGFRMKIKTSEYATLHFVKDSINSERRLFEAVVREHSDDIKAMFTDDPVAVARIEEMEKRVAGIYNSLVNSVDSFYEANKHLIRKDYAIKGQKELSSLEFSLAMCKYIGKTIDYKETLIKHRKDFAIED